MRFKDYLREAKHRQDISIEQAQELLQAHCSDALKHLDKPLWRGFSGKEDAYLVQGELGGRGSANTTNHYTVLMDHFLTPLGYPKRSASIIMANNENLRAASSYGEIYAVFPYDGVKIGVCEDEDIWFTKFTIGAATHAQKIDAWNDFFDDAGIPDHSYQDLVQGIKETIENKEDEYYSLMRNVFGFDPAKIEEILKEAYSPKNLGLHLATSADIQKYEDRDRELWIGGKCIALHKKDVWEKMVEKEA
jgi:hypothetical protein